VCCCWALTEPANNKNETITTAITFGIMEDLIMGAAIENTESFCDFVSTKKLALLPLGVLDKSWGFFFRHHEKR
jgi:pyruvoyl-dependent arginine decarboxylase (PvlArgDC)